MEVDFFIVLYHFNESFTLLMVGLYYVYIVHLTVMSKEQVKFSFVSDMSEILESYSEQHLEDILKSVETTILTSHRE